MVKKIIQQDEESRLFCKAAFSRDHSRLENVEGSEESPYKKDVNRILYSKAYSRYIDKTQVVYLVENDHITHRGLHVQLVSLLSRQIGEDLGLNLHLIEAIALGHDVGHPPFGHEGEGYLSNLSIEFLGKPFMHPLQSCRLLSEIENLNLGLHVLDGFLCHDGGIQDRFYRPQWGKTWEHHFLEREKKETQPHLDLMPGTLEGCLVKLCDTLSYLGRDIEDAIQLGIIARQSIPKTILGSHNDEMLQVLSEDILRESQGKEFIALSQECFEAIKTLRKFNFEQIYMNPILKTESKKIEQGYKLLFTWLLEDFKGAGKKSYIWSHFLHDKPPSYVDKTDQIQMVLDYISGMTDTFFIRTIEKIFIPSKIQLVCDL